jgi:L-threonylcarbamoyladenylate synthase
LLSPKIADASDRDAIRQAAQIIRSGGLVAFPTETVYGLGADAGNPQAVAKIFEVKARPRMDPVIIHVTDIAAAKRFGKFPRSADPLMRQFWPGPLTLIVERRSSVPEIVTAGLETVAIRVPDHPAALALIAAAGCGIAAPSANPFGYVSPTEARHVAEQLGEAVDMILDGGPCTIGVESTILSLRGPIPCVLRAGGTTVEDLQSVLGRVEVYSGFTKRPQSPGQLIRHYATRLHLDIVDEASETLAQGEKVGLLCMMPPANIEKYAAVEILSYSGSLREAAAKLFGALRRLDSMPLDRIIARPVKEEGLGLAIMDRLRRCSTR